MCYDRILNDDAVLQASAVALARSELRCGLRNGSLAGLMVLAVLLFQGAPAWVVAVSVLGAVALGTLLHEAIFLTGAGVRRARANRERASASSG